MYIIIIMCLEIIKINLIVALLQWNTPVSIDKCNRNHIADHHFLQVFNHGHYATNKKKPKSQSVYNNGILTNHGN